MAADPDRLLPAVSDRRTWDEAARSIGNRRLEALVDAGAAAAEARMPPLTASDWLEYDRTGGRGRYESALWRRQEMLTSLVLAELLENRGRFLDPILDVAWAICEQSSWALPAHERYLTDPTAPHLDLGAAETALLMAELDTLLGERLPVELRRRIRHEVDRRCLSPLLTRDHWGWLGPTIKAAANWAAVCSAGIVGAAAHLEPDAARLGALIDRVARPLDDYLAFFGADGGTSEGVSYWLYGFGHYTLLSELLEHRTGARVSLLDKPRIREIARFPLHVRLGRQRYVNFADCSAEVAIPPSLLTYLAGRLDLPELGALAAEQPMLVEPRRLWCQVRDLLRPVPQGPGAVPVSARDWLPSLGWMVARLDPADPDALTLAAKAGHNGEMHNHNDVGNVIVQIGGEALVIDLGRGPYSLQYFHPDTRYDHLLTSSRGHSVPVVNGQLQAAGEAHGAREVRHDDDSLSMELRDAYPETAGLASLRRTVSLDRAAGTIHLRDLARFHAGPGRLESVLVTTAQVELSVGAAVLHGAGASLRVSFEPEALRVDVETIPDVQLVERRTTVRRLVFRPRRPAAEADVRLALARA
jgi:Heparinase II/III-like protein